MSLKYYVKNVSPSMGVYNLITRDQRGNKMSLILAKNEVSRALNPSEFNSPEIQKALKARDLVNVTARMI